MNDKTAEHITADSSSAKADSVTIGSAKNAVENTPSLFKNNLLVPTQYSPQLHITKYDYGIAAVLLVLFVFFVWLYTSNLKTINQVVKDFFQFRYGAKQPRESTAIGNRAYIFMSSLFIIALSILIGRILDYYGIKLFSINLPDEIILGTLIILMYAIKLLIIKLAGFIFKLQPEASRYFHQVISYCNSLGLFLLPVIIFLSFFKQASPLIFISAGVALVACFLFIRMFNGLVLGLNSSKISKFYLFIYLCALEILPLIIIGKLVILRIH
jgi:hypothetical protein